MARPSQNGETPSQAKSAAAGATPKEAQKPSSAAQQKQPSTPSRQTKQDVFEQPQNPAEDEEDDEDEEEDEDEDEEGEDDEADDATGAATATAGGAKEGLTSKAEETKDQAESKGDEAKDATGDATDAAADKGEEAKDAAGEAPDAAGEKGEEVKDAAGEKGEEANDATGALDGAKETAEGAAEGGEGEGEEINPIGTVKEGGNVVADDGTVVGTVAGDEDPRKFAGSVVDEEGDILDEEGNVIGGAEPNADGAVEDAEDAANVGGAVEGAKDAGDVGGLSEKVKDLGVAGALGLDLSEPLSYAKDGQVTDKAGKPIGKLTEGDPKKLAEQKIKEISPDGGLVGEDGEVLGKVELPEDLGKASEDAGAVSEKVKDLGVAGVLGLDLSEPLSYAEDGQVTDKAGKPIGKLTEGDPKKLAEQKIKEISPDGKLIGEDGEVLGKVELPEDLEKAAEEGAPKIDNSVLKGKKVNKSGNVVDDDGNVWGKVIEGDAKQMAGKTVDEEGQVWNESGKVIGKCEALPEDERQVGGEAPFESFPENKCLRNGDVVSDGAVIGKVVDGDLKKCEGHSVDPDGDISDKNGNTIGRAERVEDEPEPEAEPEKDLSLLAGKRVNKQGKLVDEHGSLFGIVVEGDVKKLQGKMADKQGQIWSEGGEVIGKADLLPESEREAQKDGPFANYDGCKVQKDGTVVSTGGDIIGRLTEGDPKALAGHVVDADGDVVDNNGNSIGKAERWEPEEKVGEKHPCAGYKVNSEGNVVGDSGDVIGKLTEGNLEQCRGIEIDDDGDLSNQKGQRIGHVTRIQDIHEKSEEEIAAEKKAAEDEEAKKLEDEEKEKDAKLVRQMTVKVEDGLEKVKPMLKEMTNKINDAEATPENERDEEKLVKEVKPLIEDAGHVLEDINKDIRALDPDGRIQNQSKQKQAAGEATPQEHHLADLLKSLSSEVQWTIENGKKKLNGMPHAKKGINPLWGLLSQPLAQILAAVGLLLSGVLGLVGQLLGGLGLGGLVDGILGGLGIDKILKSITG